MVAGFCAVGVYRICPRRPAEFAIPASGERTHLLFDFHAIPIEYMNIVFEGGCCAPMP